MKTKKSFNKVCKFITKDKTRMIFIGAISLIFILTLFIITGLVSHRNNVISLTQLEATINVSDYIGFNLDKDKLHFGTAFPGGSSVREMTLSSEFPGYVYIMGDDDFADWLYVSSQGDYLPENTYLPLKMRMRVPSDAAPGDYSFSINVLITEKPVNFVYRTFFGNRFAYTESFFEGEGSGRIQLNIVNSTANISESEN